MTTAHHDSPATVQRASSLSCSITAALWMVAVIGVFFLLRENWDQFAGHWIYLVLLACPLMHLFHGHRGHANPSAKKE